MKKNQNVNNMNKVANIGIALGLSVIIVLFNFTIFHLVFPNYDFPRPRVPIYRTDILFFTCTVAPFIEELVFRHLPLKVLSKLSCYEEIKWYLVAIIACIFGWIHGNSVNILVQGVAGFFFGWVYIKNNNSYISAVVVHSLYNFTVLYILPTLITLSFTTNGL